MLERELTPADYIAMFRRRWVLIVLFTLLGGPLAYGIARVIPPRYKSQTVVLVDQPSVSSDIVKPVDTAGIGQRLASMQEQILSRSRLEPIIRQAGLYPKDIDKKPMEDLVAKLRKSIEVTPVEAMAETRSNSLPGFNVSVTLDNPRTAQEICTTITSLFIEENLRVAQQRSEDTTQFLSQQLQDAKAKLDDQDSKLAAFKSRYLGSLPDQEQTNMNLLTSLNSQLDAATQALNRAEQDKTFAQSMLTQQLDAWQATQVGGQSPDTLDQQLTTAQAELATLQARYTDDYPDVIKTKNDIAAIKKKIADSQNDAKTATPEKSGHTAVEPPQIQQLRGQIHTYDLAISEKGKEQEQIKEQIKLYQGRVQSSPAVEEEYKALTRDYQTALEFYNDLLKKRDQSAMATDLTRQQQGEQFRVLDPANLPDKPTFPDRLLFTLGGVAGGLCLGVGLAFFLELRNTALRTERDVEFSLRLPVLAMIPPIEPVSTKRLKHRASRPPADSASGLGVRT